MNWYSQLKLSAIEIDPETGEEILVDDNSIDEEIERMFGKDIKRKRNYLGLYSDKWKHRRANPAARNYLSRSQRMNMQAPLRDYTIVAPETPPKPY